MPGLGFIDRTLTEAEVAAVIHAAITDWQLTDRRVLVILPDGTRTAPIPQLFRLLCAELRGTSRRAGLSDRAGHASAR